MVHAVLLDRLNIVVPAASHHLIEEIECRICSRISVRKRPGAVIRFCTRQ